MQSAILPAASIMVGISGLLPIVLQAFLNVVLKPPDSLKFPLSGGDNFANRRVLRN